MNIPRPGPGEALLLNVATGEWCVVPRSAITGEPVASIEGIPEHQLDEAVARVLGLLTEGEDE
jgi:hypothetical protein